MAPVIVDSTALLFPTGSPTPPVPSDVTPTISRVSPPWVVYCIPALVFAAVIIYLAWRMPDKIGVVPAADKEVKDASRSPERLDKSAPMAKPVITEPAPAYTAMEDKAASHKPKPLSWHASLEALKEESRRRTLKKLIAAEPASAPVSRLFGKCAGIDKPADAYTPAPRKQKPLSWNASLNALKEESRRAGVQMSERPTTAKSAPRAVWARGAGCRVLDRKFVVRKCPREDSPVRRMALTPSRPDSGPRSMTRAFSVNFARTPRVEGARRLLKIGGVRVPSTALDEYAPQYNTLLYYTPTAFIRQYKNGLKS
ncbi:hypothetical protein B0H11DRAFT_2421548 [Mycena galericulata]|nr:hypothetical protein B0H11DRAFT_2421548 [Mycena galericulata]